MSKYDRLEDISSEFDIEQILVDGEQLLWKDKPNKKAFIWNKIMGGLPVIILWLLIDSIFLFQAIFGKMDAFSRIAILAFLAFHLFPVWMWLGGIITASKRCDNTTYCLTNKRIIVNTGFIGMSYKSIYYSEIEDVNLKIGIIDKMLKVGDIIISTKSNNEYIFDIENSLKVYGNIQKIVADMKSDMAYPNALRPDVNPGYNTEYAPKK